MKCELCEQMGDVIVQHQDWRVVEVNDSHYPGFCRVIWNAHVKEMTELNATQRNQMMDVVWQVEAVIREVMQPHKVNLASLGNVVPHVHWHVIPRYTDDMHFPNPIWGKVERSVNDNLLHRQTLAATLKSAIQEKLGSV
ncbi:diadenosine tetraphosphate (Ap4A) HIT family hydrolase [Oxalobacteraceae bacterium GrIS 2.11]